MPARRFDTRECRNQWLIVHYGPFVMNSHEEIVTAIEDFQAGRMGVVPALIA